jgi:hypothetical protein
MRLDIESFHHLIENRAIVTPALSFQRQGEPLLGFSAALTQYSYTLRSY